MARPFHFALLLSALTAPLLLWAQTAPAPLAAPAAPATTPPAAAPATPLNPAPERTIHAISPGIAAQLAASRPKFTPIAPPPPPKPEEELPDLREIDKPKNTIVRLPKYVVQEPKSPIFRERDIHTKEGLANLAMRRYLTEADRALNRFRLPLFGISNEDRAMAMYYEDERLKNMADVADNTNMVMKSDPTAGAKMKSAAQQTFMRWSDIGYQGGSNK
jgi:hypothetical protein